MLNLKSLRDRTTPIPKSQTTTDRDLLFMRTESGSFVDVSAVVEALQWVPGMLLSHCRIPVFLPVCPTACYPATPRSRHNGEMGRRRRTSTANLELVECEFLFFSLHDANNKQIIGLGFRNISKRKQWREVLHKAWGWVRELSRLNLTGRRLLAAWPELTLVGGDRNTYVWLKVEDKRRPARML